jgi:acyl-CoA hydrolase
MKFPHESAYSLRVPAYPSDADETGHIKAGPVLKLIDLGGAIPAKRHVGEGLTVVTASLDRTDFLNPLYPWEMIELDARLTRVWNTSMESRVIVRAWNYETGETRDISEAYVVMVALDYSGGRVPVERVPELTLDSEEDRQLASAADLRREIRKKEDVQTSFIEICDAEDDPTILSRRMTAQDANAVGNVFGGVLLELIHQVGRAAAHGHVPDGNFVCVRQDRMSFIEPAAVGEIIRAKAVVAQTWNTSMEVQVELCAINPKDASKRRIASSYLVYVRMDENHKPTLMPRWEAANDQQRERAEAANIRRGFRLEEQRLMQSSAV